MTFKLPGRPSTRAEVHELADFAELLACVNGKVSTREIVAILGREGESEPNVGCEDIDDDNADDLDEAMSEIESRQRACRDGYPFELNSVGNVLTYIGSDDKHLSVLYRYLLLATRLNMTSAKKHAEIDGTLLFEEVSACVLRHYLGTNRAKANVFGTAVGSGNFPGKVTEMCKDLGEATGFRNVHGVQVNANDDKLDVVGWIPFADTTPAQIIIFGQCKTGTGWSDKLCQLQPGAFIKRWIDGHFMLDPVRAFFVTEAVNRARLGFHAAEGGLLFDRCRILDCCIDISESLLDKMRNWSNAALEFSKPNL